MIIRKNKKIQESIVIIIQFPHDQADSKFNDGTKCKSFRLSLSDIRSPDSLRNALEKFLKEYVKAE